MSKRFWVGGYSPDGGGTSQGIRAMELRNGALTDLGLAHAAESPSWLVTHPKLQVLYAALEHRGELATYRILGPDRLEPLGGPVAAGELVCHLAVAGTSLIASCYGDGKILVYLMGAEGLLGSPSVAPASVDPFRVSGRAERASHSHQATVLRSGRIATTDLGHDVLRIWDLVDGELLLVQLVVMRKGDGPRHLVEHPSGFIYVVTEHGAEVITLGASPAGEYKEVARTGLGEQIVPGEHYPAEISLDRLCNRLYVGVRGAQRLVVLSLHAGIPAVVGSQRSAGQWPRHHLQVGSTMLVANQLSNTIEAFELDAADGVPHRQLGSLGIESPTCITAQVSV